MAMVGAFLGWQPTVIAFFVSPMLAIVIVLVRYLVTGDNQTLWDLTCVPEYGDAHRMGQIVERLLSELARSSRPGTVSDSVGALALMGAMLWIWRLLKQMILSRS